MIDPRGIFEIKKDCWILTDKPDKFHKGTYKIIMEYNDNWVMVDFRDGLQRKLNHDGY